MGFWEAPQHTDGGAAYPAKAAGAQDPVGAIRADADGEIVGEELPGTVLNSVEHVLYRLPCHLILTDLLWLFRILQQLSDQPALAQLPICQPMHPT